MDNADRFNSIGDLLVSIVTPSYNAMPFIAENIESVLAQNYPAIEHIIFDGNSTDGTRELLAQYPHLVWVSEPDRGQSDALNKGFKRANGEIIGWLNADDMYQPGAVSAAVQYLIQHDDVDLVHTDVYIIDETSDVVGISRAQEVDTKGLLFANPIKQPTIFMRRRVIEQLVGLDESLHYVMDWEFWLRASVAFNLRYLPGEIFARFRFAPGTKSFESAPAFNLEWAQVLRHVQNDPAFAALPAAAIRRAMRQTEAQHHLGNMLQAINQGARGQMFAHLAKAVALNWKLIFNRGIYLFVHQGLMGKSVDRLRKYKKHRRITTC